MTQQQPKGGRAGRHNAAQPRPPEATAPADGAGTLGVPIDAGLTDLGDDVARGAEDRGSPGMAERGRLEGGSDAGLTDLGDDGDLPVELDDDDRPR